MLQQVFKPPMHADHQKEVMTNGDKLPAKILSPAFITVIHHYYSSLLSDDRRASAA